MTIPISTLVNAYRCPRRSYFDKERQQIDDSRYIICKQIATSANSAVSEDDLWNEILLIKPDIDGTLYDDFRSWFERIQSVPIRPFTQTDLMVTSEKYGLSGMIDKYDAGSGEIALVRSGKAPDIGCWPTDRLRMAAILLCLQESTKHSLTGGYIEYIPSGVVRYCEPEPRDRRAFIQSLKKVQAIEKGEIPSIPANPPCKNCQYQKQCTPPRPRTLLEIFSKKG